MSCGKNQAGGRWKIPAMVLMLLGVLAVASCNDSGNTGSTPPTSPPLTPNEICVAQRNDAVNACYVSSCTGCAGLACLFCGGSCEYDPAVWSTYYSCCQTQGCVQSISGYVKTGDSTPVAGVSMSFTGETSVLTDANGYYEFPSTGAGTLTPTKAGYCFSPESLYFPMSYEIFANQDFVAQQTCYSISGTVTASDGSPLGVVNVDLSGAVTTSAVTDTSGVYTFNSLANGAYTVTPNYFGLSPVTIDVNISGASVTGQDFTVTGRTISGKVTANDGGAIAGVTITLSGSTSATTTTAVDGSYAFVGLAAGSYVVTPSTSCTSYSFDKTSINADIAFADVTGQDFLVSTSPYDISGTVIAGGAPLPGVTLTRSSGTETYATTDSGGNYSFSAIQDSINSLVTPSLTGYVFSPINREISVCSLLIGVQDFQAASTWFKEGADLYGRPSIHRMSTGGYLALSSNTLARLDETGNTVWAKQFSGIYFTELKETSGGGAILVGRSSQAEVILVDSAGNITWQKKLGTNNVDINPVHVNVVPGGGYLVTTGLDGDIWVVKMDSTGDILWQKTYGGADWDGAEDVDIDASGNFILAGGTVSFGVTNTAYWVLKLNSDGDVLWQLQLDGNSVDRAYAVKATSDGGYLVGGQSYSFTGSSWIMRLDKDGNISWQKSFSTWGIFDIDATADGNYVVLGKSNYNEAWLMKMDGSGGSIWQRRYLASQSIDYSDSLEVDEIPGSGFMIAGDRILIKTDSSGNLDLCDLDQTATATSVDTNATAATTNATTTSTTASSTNITLTPQPGMLSVSQTCPAP